MYEKVDEERKLGWSKKGVRFINEEHERRELEKERQREETGKEVRER